MTTPASEDEFTELVDADFPRVDLVGKGANGIPRFLIAKQDGSEGLFDPEFVRDLIAKAEPEESGRERVTMPSGMTLTGSPADIAAFIHKAAQRATDPDGVAKAEMSSKSQNDLPDSAFAYIEPGGKKDEEGKTTPRSLRHFPIHDAAHARNALSRAPQSPFGDKAMPKIRSAAKKFGIEVSKETAVTDAVSKDMGPGLDEGIDGLDPTVPLAAPEGEAPGDPTDPGSPAWEAIDAATASKWTSILSRARVAVDLLSEREMLEAASADPDDVENAWDLQDVCCAIDYAISVLAPFAVAEQSEADCGADAMAMIGKAMEGLGGVPLERIEGLVAVAKAGRVLSSANEAEIRSAAASLQKVLTSLPAAPQTDDSGQPVAKQKETAMAADPTETAPVAEDASAQVAKDAATPEAPPAAAATEAVASEGVVAKDGGDGKVSMQAVYDSSGCLVGVVDPGQITPVEGGDAPAGDDGASGASDAGAGDGTAADAGDMTPQPPAEAGTPADDVAKDAADGEGKTSVGANAHEVLKSIVAELVAAELEGRAPAQDIAKQADVAGLGETVETLKARIATLEEQPAAPKVFTNGAVPPAHTLRGQDHTPQGTPPVDVAKAAELKSTLYKGTAPEQNQAALDMQQMAIAQLSAIHSGR